MANRSRIASGSAVRDCMAAAYLTISSYCCSISSQSIGLERIGSKLESRVRMPAWGRASFWRATAFSRSEEHTSELQSLMRISSAVSCFKKKNLTHIHNHDQASHLQ